MNTKKVMTAALAACCLVLSAGLAINATGASTPKDKVLFGVLNGKNEIGTDGKKRAGDLDGKGSATAIVAEGKLCYGLTNKNISNPTGAHIHKGTRGHNGPIVVTLTAPSDGTRGASSDCVNIDPALAKQIQKNPQKFYWNIHSSEKTGGAIRGQVSARSN